LITYFGRETTGDATCRQHPVSLIFTILLASVPLVKYYELIRYKEKLDIKNWLYWILASFAVIAIFAERFQKSFLKVNVRHRR
jgi:hypothetical protein